MRTITIPDGAVEIARLTTRAGRTLMIAYCATDGTYGYRGDGAGGSGQTLRDVCARLNDAREWPGGKTAVLTGIKALFDTEGGYVTRAGGISI